VIAPTVKDVTVVWSVCLSLVHCAKAVGGMRCSLAWTTDNYVTPKWLCIRQWSRFTLCMEEKRRTRIKTRENLHSKLPPNRHWNHSSAA